MFLRFVQRYTILTHTFYYHHDNLTALDNQ
jgi:hypothetical protein